MNEDKALFAVVRKAVELGLFPRAVDCDTYLANVEKARELIGAVESARTPGPDVSRLLAAAKEMLECEKGHIHPHVVDELEAAVAEYEAAERWGGIPMCTDSQAGT
jgi:hypothetical protein